MELSWVGVERTGVERGAVELRGINPGEMKLIQLDLMGAGSGKDLRSVVWN